MLQRENTTSIGGIIISFLAIVSVLFVKLGFVQSTGWYWGLFITLPLMLIAILDLRQKQIRVLHKQIREKLKDWKKNFQHLN